MEQFWASGNGDSESSGSQTLSEGDEEKVTVLLDIKVCGDGDNGHVSDWNGSDGNTQCDKETPGGEESEDDEDEKVNTPVGTYL